MYPSRLDPKKPTSSIPPAHNKVTQNENTNTKSRGRLKPQIDPAGDLPQKLLTAKQRISISLTLRGLPHFPEEFEKLKHLKVIDLGQNNIEEIPKWISSFKLLTVSRY